MADVRRLVDERETRLLEAFSRFASAAFPSHLEDASVFLVTALYKKFVSRALSRTEANRNSENNTTYADTKENGQIIR